MYVYIVQCVLYVVPENIPVDVEVSSSLKYSSHLHLEQSDPLVQLLLHCVEAAVERGGV